MAGHGPAGSHARIVVWQIGRASCRGRSVTRVQTCALPISSQVWSDAQRANATVAREASALRTVILFAADFPGETEARIRALVHRHIQDAVNHEWPAMARQEATLAMSSGRSEERRVGEDR